MSDTTTRALALLNLLQTHRHWPGSELAERLGVTERTVRRDVERLRELGYRIESAVGAAGGYRLEAGNALPPLLLTDDEAVAMAIGLRVAASQRLVSGPETTITALAKLEKVLPSRLRRRVSALAQAVEPSAISAGAPVSSEVLGDLALACRDHERVRFSYTSISGVTTRRDVEPHVLAPGDRNWYLLCWDRDRDDWRTMRVDRIADLELLRARFTPRPLTSEEVEELILVARSWTPQPVEADVVMELPIERMREVWGQWSQGATPEGPDRTRWPIGGADFRESMYAMSWIPTGVGYTTNLPEPERSELRETLERMLRALAD
ncbi:helix-turn-helix transcriptional regulator [Salana multivorans]